MKGNQILVGKTIRAVYLAEDAKAIRFDVDGIALKEEPIVAHVDGYCCSNSWIESVEAPDVLIGATVASVDEIRMPEGAEEPVGYGDVIAFYGLKITTNKGVCVIDYRNQSNGYYGGNLSWPGERFYGGVYNQNVSNEEWKKIA